MQCSYFSHVVQSCHRTTNLQGLPQETEKHPSKLLFQSDQKEEKIAESLLHNSHLRESIIHGPPWDEDQTWVLFPSLCSEGLSSSSTILHTSYEAQECQDAYPANVSHQKKLLTLRIMEHQLSRRLGSSSGGKIWNHLEILEISLWWKWLGILLHWVYKATFWSLRWTARITSLRSSHMPAPHGSSGHRAQLSPAAKVVAPLGKLI